VGIIVAPRGRLMVAMTFTFRNGKVAELGIITDRERLRQLDITI
jgi:RNA polymerase sigma-70 factor, ECF subfamily